MALYSKGHRANSATDASGPLCYSELALSSLSILKSTSLNQSRQPVMVVPPCLMPGMSPDARPMSAPTATVMMSFRISAYAQGQQAQKSSGTVEVQRSLQNGDPASLHLERHARISPWSISRRSTDVYPISEVFEQVAWYDNVGMPKVWGRYLTNPAGGAFLPRWLRSVQYVLLTGPLSGTRLRPPVCQPTDGNTS